MSGRPLLDLSFFQRPVDTVARDLIGCVLRRRLDGVWLGAQIVETEAYGLDDPASHAYLGRTPSREPMWMPPGTIYMYHSRAGASLNVSCGTGPEAVLIKAGAPVVDVLSPQAAFGCDAPTESGARRSVEAGGAASVRGADVAVPVVGFDGGGVDGAAVRPRVGFTSRPGTHGRASSRRCGWGFGPNGTRRTAVALRGPRLCQIGHEQSVAARRSGRAGLLGDRTRRGLSPGLPRRAGRWPGGWRARRR